MDLNIQPKNVQHFTLTEEMRQGLEVLQMPIIELADWIAQQIEQNPLLEYKEQLGEKREYSDTIEELDFDYPSFQILESFDEEFIANLFEEYSINTPREISKKQTIFEYLMKQAKETWSSEYELRIAEWIIGNLDESGFFTLPLDQKEEVVLKTIQQFDPPGIAARDIRESLLIQLSQKGKQNELIYEIIKNEFEDFIKYKITSLSKKFSLNAGEVRSLIHQEMKTCSPYPICKLTDFEPQFPIPDLFILKEESRWKIELNEKKIPQFQWSSIYFKQLSGAERRYLKPFLLSGKWLHKMIQQRQRTLRNLAHFLLQKQLPFFEGEVASLIPLSIREAAHSLNMHGSTISRAISNKFLSCPRGIYPLRAFFPLTSQMTLEIIQKLIQQEDKHDPISDEKISHELKKFGVNCARRTVTKYRKLLRIGSIVQRKK